MALYWQEVRKISTREQIRECVSAVQSLQVAEPVQTQDDRINTMSTATSELELAVGHQYIPVDFLHRFPTNSR